MLTRKAFWLVGAMSVLLGGFGIGTAATLTNDEVKPAQALSETKATYICRITKGNNITTLPDNMWAYSWSAISAGDPTNETGVSTSMTLTSSSEAEKVFTISLSIDYGHIIYKDAAEWPAGVHQTGDLDTDYVQSLASPYTVEFAITDFSSNRYVGSFVTGGFPTFNSSYCRIWGDPSSSTTYKYGYNWTIRYWNGSTIDKEIPVTGFCNLATGTGNRWAGYFDVPTEIIGCYRQAKVYGSNVGNFAKATEKDNGENYGTYVSGDNAFLYYFTESSSNIYLTRGIAAKDSAPQSIPASVIATVLEGYFTCSADMNNGYGNFRTLTENWIHNFAETQVWWIAGSLSEVTLNDFDGSTANTEVYEDGTPRSTSTNAYDKYQRMTALYDSNHGVGSFSFFSSEKGTSSSMFLLIGAGCLGAVAFYFFLKKKKVSIA